MTKKQAPPAELSPEALELIRQLDEAKAAKAAWEEQVEKLRQEVINLLGEATEGQAGGKTVVRYTKVARTWVDSKSLKVFHPEVYDHVTHTQTSYQLRTYL